MFSFLLILIPIFAHAFFNLLNDRRQGKKRAGAILTIILLMVAIYLKSINL